jgi:hypothetical protein
MFRWSMIFSENRHPLFGIMLWRLPAAALARTTIEGRAIIATQAAGRGLQPRAGAGEAVPNPAGFGLAMVSTNAAATMQSAPAAKNAGR